MAKKKHTDDPDLHGGRMRVPRSRGAFSGMMLIIAGVWGALIPFVGPIVDFGYTPNSNFDLTRARFWLELLPGAVAAVGGLLLLVAANRLVTSFGAWLAVAGGAWFLVGPALDTLLHLGPIGSPIHRSTLGSTLETLLLFDGIGALILFLGALAVGRLGVVSVGDVRSAQRRERQKDDDERDARDARIAARTTRTDDGRGTLAHDRASDAASGNGDQRQDSSSRDDDANGARHTSPTPRRTQSPERR